MINDCDGGSGSTELNFPTQQVLWITDIPAEPQTFVLI